MALDQTTTPAEQFVYKLRSRNRLNFFVTFCALAFAGFLIVIPAPWWLIMLVLLLTAIQVFTVAVDARANFLIDEKRLKVVSHSRRFYFQIDDIELVDTKNRSDRTNICVHTINGSKTQIPYYLCPPKKVLIEELTKRGVPITTL